jgi:NAD(P)-dependent dehydrogenase (short-subunit alcohol dehydrogenase family)
VSRVALVTGAGQGIGAATAARLARDGFAVVVNDLRPDTAAAVAEEVSGRAAPFDVARADLAEAAIAEVERDLGPVDVLVACHAFMTMAPFLETTEEDWRQTLEVNLHATAWLLERVAGPMRERGWGRIVVFASEWGVTGWPNATAYAASKGGLVALVKSAARALGRDGVAVNAIAPGVTDTPQLEVDAADAGVSREEIARRYGRDVPLGRVGRPEEIAEVVAFLCSDAAIALVGQVVQPNGGTTRAWT